MSIFGIIEDMKKTFEFLIILIIFYGIYSAFKKAALLLSQPIDQLWIVISSLVASALVLTLYSQVVRSSVIKKYKSKIKELEKELEVKDQEVDDAFKIKRDVEVEAEKTIVEEE